jgi:hypothetical protein
MRDRVAYHILIDSDASDDPKFDCYIGSAVSVCIYWERVGRKLGLSIISEITERADSEEGFSISSDALYRFRDELISLEGYWKSGVDVFGTPDGFLERLGEIIAAVDKAILHEASVYIY